MLDRNVSLPRYHPHACEPPQYQLATLPIQTLCMRLPDGRAAMMATPVLFYSSFTCSHCKSYQPSIQSLHLDHFDKVFRFVDITSPQLYKLLCERGLTRFPFISIQYILFISTHLKSSRSMQDPRFCSTCGTGPFLNVKNHSNKCKESKRRDVEFMRSIHGVKQDGLTLENEI